MCMFYLDPDTVNCVGFEVLEEERGVIGAAGGQDAVARVIDVVVCYGVAVTGWPRPGEA